MNSSLIIHVICGLLLLVIPAAVLYLWDKKLLRTFGVAVARMIGQLLVACLMVWALFRFDYLALHLGWLVLLACYTAAVVLIRLKLNVRRFLWPVAVGQLVGMLLPGFYLRLAVLPLDQSLYTTWFVPVMALLAGHTTASQIRGLGTYFSALKVDEQEYEYRRGNGKNDPLTCFCQPICDGALYVAFVALRTAFVRHGAIYRLCGDGGADISLCGGFCVGTDCESLAV